MAAKEPIIIRDKDEMRKWTRTMGAQGHTIGFVPTMGYLHEGHLSLIQEAHKHTDRIVVPIYVNPGQFSPNEDLSTYPSDFQGDIKKLKSVCNGVDVVFNPKNLYEYANSQIGNGHERNIKEGKVVSCVESDHETWVRVENLEKGLCGKSRPVFFRGVATVVTKLFNIVDPNVAVFGKKDNQQWRIIRRMATFLTLCLDGSYSWFHNVQYRIVSLDEFIFTRTLQILVAPVPTQQGSWVQVWDPHRIWLLILGTLTTSMTKKDRSEILILG